MKAYLFEHSPVGAGGSRHELYVPGFGILWPEFGRIITHSEDITKMQKRINTIHEWRRKGLTEMNAVTSVPNYELVGEKEIPKYLLDDFIGWIKSEEISREGRKESGKKLKDLFRIKPAELITDEQRIENMARLYK